MFRGRRFPALLVLVLLTAVLFRGESALAYALEESHWTLNRSVMMNLSLGGPRQLEDGFSSFNESAADALTIWNNYLAHMRFNFLLNSPLPAEGNDADNSAFFSATVYGQTFGAGVLAVTLISTRDAITTETDVIFNSAVNWNSYRGSLRACPPTSPNCSGPLVDFHRVALHEFGHALGLDHPDEAGQNVNAIMNSFVSNTDALTPDDIAGARSIYDNGPSRLAANPTSSLLNLSTRAFVSTGDNVLIGGFIIQGQQPATVLLRAIGHSLAARGLGNPLADPEMELRDSSGTLVAQNDDWIDSTDAETIASFGFDPPNSRESAILRTLNSGAYTAIVRAFDNQDGNLTGVGLFELYDLHTSGGRAANISSRGRVLSGDDVMIAGFIIGGRQAKEVVVRAIGPTLAGAGIPNALPNPKLELRDSSGTLIRTNDNWESDANAGRVQQAGLAPGQPVEAALDASLNPGAYTAIVRGVDGSTGIGLVEVYDLSASP